MNEKDEGQSLHQNGADLNRVAEGPIRGEPSTVCLMIMAEHFEPPMKHSIDQPGQPSFCVPKSAITCLVKAGASSGTVCTYLILAGYSDASGSVSTAGLGAIRKRLGVREAVAARFIAELEQAGVIRDIRPPKGLRSAERAQDRFLIADFGESLDKRAWFCRTMVDEDPEWGCPARKLYHLEPSAVYTILYAHACYNEFSLSVLPPQPSMQQPGIAFNYSVEGDCDSWGDDHQIKVAHSPELVCWGFPINGETLKGALAALRSAGFLYENIIVFDRALESHPQTADAFLPFDAQPLYLLHVRKPSFKLPADEVGVAESLKPIADAFGTEMLFEDGKFQHRYIAMAKPGHRISILGVLQLRYRVRNPRNRGVASGWLNFMNSHREYKKWIESMIHKYL